MITLSCGLKVLAVCSFVSSQSTRLADERIDRQNYDPKTALAQLLHAVKTVLVVAFHPLNDI